MALATLSIDLVAKLANLEAGMDKAGRIAERQAAQIERAFARSGALVRTLGAALASAFAGVSIAGFLRDTTDAIDRLNDVADATGATVENLSALEDVARRNGATLDDFAAILVKFNGALNAADGNSGASRALQAIGLDAAQLKRIDPAEALRQTAVALAGFADDGNKARLVQELFGKSIREAAPLLKDLAEQGRLNATVTAQQAAEAERFNKQLAQLQTHAGNAGRALVAGLLPALNDVLARVRTASDVFGGFFKGLAALNPLEGEFKNALTGLETYRAELAELEAAQSKLRDTGAQARQFGRVALDQNRQRQEAVRKLIEYHERLLALDGRAGAGRGFVNPLASLPEPAPAADKPGREPARPRVAGAADILAGEPFNLRRFELGQTDETNAALGAEALRRYNDERARLQALIEATPFAQQQRLEADIRRLNDAYAAGAVDEKTYAQALFTLDQGLRQVAPAAAQAQQAMSEFSREAARNIQDALGDSVLATLEGDFDRLEDSWKRTLLRMAAEAAAADIGELVLGGFGKTGQVGGVFGSLLSLFGFAKGGVVPFANGGVVGSPTLFRFAQGTGLMGEAGPEAIMPLARGRDGRLGVASQGGGGIVNHITVAAGPSRAEVLSAISLAMGALRGEFRGQLRSAGVL